jgi:hypothetical protein
MPAINPLGPTYITRWARIAVTALQDLASVLPATGIPIVPLRAWVSQSSDAGDAQDEMLPVTLQWGATTAGSGGNSFTALKQSPKAAAFGGTCRINDTTPASAGTIVEPYPDSFSVRAGWLYLPVPEERFIVDTGRLVLGLLANPADSITCSGGIIFAELY